MKRTIKTLLLSALCICMLLAATPNLGSPVFAAEIVDSGYCGGEGDGTNLTWTLDSDGLLTISGTGEMEKGDSFNYRVPWNQYLDLIKKISINPGVKNIGMDAFQGCANLSSIAIPDSVTNIGAGAFWGCTSLSSIAIPDSVTSIGGQAFFETAWFESQPDGLVYAGKVAYKYKGIMPENTSIILNNETLGIAGYAFESCNGLTSIAIPDGVTNIGNSAFQNCKELANIIILSNVNEIGAYAFENTKWYEDQPDGLIYAGTVVYDYKGKIAPENSIVIKDGTKGIADHAFYGDSDLTSIRLPEGLINIGNDAFVNCKMVSVMIPSSVTKIGRCAFEHCKEMTSVVIPNSVESIGEEAFRGCSELASVTISDGVKRIMKSAFLDCPKITSIIIPNSVTEIGNSAFKRCSGLSSIQLSTKMKTINSGTFSESGLQSITIPNNIISIGASSFSNCTNLTSITIPNSVKSIGISSFENCSNLISITIPNSISDIGNNAFNNTAWLNNQADGLVYAGKVAYHYKGEMPEKTEISIKDGTIGIAGGAFENCTELYSVDIPKSVVCIGASAFYGCKNLTSVSIPNGVTSIRLKTFSFCDNLNSVSLPNSVKSIETYAFWACQNLSSVIFPNGISSIGYGAFEDCNIKSITIPGSVKVLAPGVFARCKNLETVVLEEGICMFQKCTESMGGYDHGTFQSCTSLKSVVLPNGLKNIGIRAFSFCSNLTSITIPYSVTLVEEDAFIGCEKLQDAYYTGTASQWEQIQIIKNSHLKWADGISPLCNDALLNAKIHFIGSNFSTISYDPNGGTGTPSAQTKTQNVPLTLSTLVPTKAFTIRFNANGGSVSPASKTVSCTFKNWNTQQNGSGTAYAPGASYTKDENVTLYAQWTNPTAGNLPTPTRDGYTFDGWYTAASGGTRIMASDTISDNTALYAHWTRKTPDQPTPDSGFVWGRDNWNFINSNYNGDFGSTSYRSQIGADYLNALQKNLTNKEYQYIFNGYGATSAWLDKKWSGSCYGMSSLTLLAKQGLMPFSQYGAGAASLFSLTRPTENAAVRSLITYYQMLQIKDVIQQQYRTVPLRTNEANIKEILSLLDANPTVLVGFRKDGWGGHAVLAYRYEYGSFTYNGVTYQGCIRICDPNASKAYDANYNIYFNTQTYQWAIPAYQSSGISSALGAKFNYVGANVNEINAGGYLSGATEQKIADYISRIDAYSIGNNRSVSKVEQADGAYVTMNTAPGDIVEDYSYILGNASDGVIGYTLMDSASAYMVTQNEPIALDVHMDYENSSLSAVSAAGKRVIFDPNGVVEVNGESAAYTLSMTFDGGHPTDWFAVEVKGGGANHASLTKAADGYILTADNLQNVTVNVNNRDHAAALTFSAAYPAVLIYEINADTVGVKVDTDNNGTYDTDLSDVASFTPGDVDADGKVTASDARLALRCAVGLENYAPGSAQFLACDVDGDKKVTASDARLILRAAVGLETLK